MKAKVTGVPFSLSVTWRKQNNPVWCYSPPPRPKFSELALKISVCGHIYSVFINKLQIPKSGLSYNSKKTSLPNISIKLLVTFLTS